MIATAKRRARIFRIIAVVILVLGGSSAGMIYWQGTRTQGLPDDADMQGFDRQARQQMGVLYGKQGELIEDWSNNLKQPNTQAAIILGVTVLAALICFQFARLSDRDAQPEDFT